MTAPAVSVLIPARNAAETIGLTLASVLRSRDVALEVVVVDHASTDATRARVDAAGDPRVRVVDAAGPLGLGEALNVGLAHCRAPLVARMDADDLMHPMRLRADVDHLRVHDDAACVASRVRPFPRAAVTPGMRAYLAWMNSVVDRAAVAREIWIEQPLCHPATTFRRAVLDAHGGWRDGPFPEDYDLFLRLHGAGLALDKRADVHHGWRMRAGSMTRTHPRYARDRHAELKARMLVARFGIDARAVIVAGAGKEGGRIGRALVAAGVRPSAYVDVAPRRIGRTRHGAPVVDAAALPSLRATMERPFLIVAVGTSGVRGIARARAEDAGFVEGETFVVVC